MSVGTRARSRPARTRCLRGSAIMVAMAALDRQSGVLRCCHGRHGGVGSPKRRLVARHCLTYSRRNRILRSNCELLQGGQRQALRNDFPVFYRTAPEQLDLSSLREAPK